MNTFIVLETSTFGAGTNAFCASDEHFSAGNECVNTCSTSAPLTHIASYQQLSSRTYYLEMIATTTGVGTRGGSERPLEENH